MQSITELLGPDGVLARHLPGFAPRVEQQEMAEAVARTLAGPGLLIAEAGTGTGKTFAYLIPAILSGQKVIISTGTKNLQDQLYNKDLPLIRDALAVPVDIALLKGRSNYLCHHRLALAVSEGRLASRSEAAALQQVREWAGRTRSGDIGEMDGVAEASPLWGRVTSTAENCLGGECDDYERCFLAHARRRAQEADLLVVNHHLLFADMALRDSGFGELLPGANAFIIDEAHQLPETASSFFGQSVTGNQLLELARDATTEDLREAGESPRLRKSATHLEKAVRDLRLAFGSAQQRGAWREIVSLIPFQQALTEVAEWLAALRQQLEPLAARGKGLEGCLRRANELEAAFATLTGETPEETIHWYETHTRSFSINLTPLDVAPIFREKIEARRSSWVFTSATLAIGDSFEHFTQRLGLVDAEARRWESPFDFPRQALLYVPEAMPDPNSPDYIRRVVEVAIEVLAESEGRAFLLFTSHRALQQAAELLQGQIDYPLLIQGEAPRGHLLEKFRSLGNAVLLGTGSFWEGVDVRGEALSLVLIDKLPFASPGDPVLKARIDAIREGGGNPFYDFQLPQAVITLKQGVGRLIRDVSDRGALVLCDPRLGSRPYGRLFIDSLPPMTRTRRPEVVKRFFQQFRPSLDEAAG